MVIISNMDTQHNIWYLPSESNHVISTNGKVSHLLIIMLILCAFSPNSRGAFYPNTILYIFFRYLKTVALIILNKTENHKEDLCLKMYALILAILIFYLNLQHFTLHQQPYHPAAQDWLPTEAKQGWAWSVPGWETSREKLGCCWKRC